MSFLAATNVLDSGDEHFYRGQSASSLPKKQQKPMKSVIFVKNSRGWATQRGFKCSLPVPSTTLCAIFFLYNIRRELLRPLRPSCLAATSSLDHICQR